MTESVHDVSEPLVIPPLAPIAGAFALGIFACWLPRGAWFLVLVTLFAAAPCFVRSRRPGAWGVVLLIVWAWVGALRLAVWAWQPPHAIGQLASERPELVVLHGVIQDDPVEPHGQARGTRSDAPRGANIPPSRTSRGLRPRPWPEGGIELVDGDHFARSAATREAIPSHPRQGGVACVAAVDAVKRSGEWQPTTGLVRVRMQAPRMPLSVGDACLFEGRLSTIRPPGNPGQFDWRAALARQRIHALLTAKSSETVVRLTHERGFSWLRALSAFRHRMEDAIQDTFGARDAGLLRSLVLGERVALDEDLKRAFVETGTIHLLVVSGFNVGLIAWLLEWSLRMLGCGRRIRLLLTGLGLVGYWGLTGMQPPVTRATVMAWVVLGALYWDCVVNWPNALAFAAMTLLWVNPAELFDPSFQLSFGAVASLLLWTKRFQPGFARLVPDRLPIVRRYLSMTLAATCAVWVGLWPVIAWYFYLISPVSILGNLLLTPSVSLLAVLGTPLALIGAITPRILVWSRGVLTLCLNFTAWAVTWCQRIPGGHWNLGRPTLLLLIGYYACACLSLGRRRLRLSAGWVAACWLMLLNVTVWGAVGHRAWDARWMEVTMLDVGHGDSIVVRTPDQRTLLVDTGTREAGRFTVLPFLQSRGWHAIDGLILTHPDEDHLGGAIALLPALRIRQVFTNGFAGRTETARQVLATVQENRLGPIQLSAGMSVAGVSGMAIQVLHPPKGFVPGTAADSNDNSVVLKLTKGRVSVLLCGDLEARGLPAILAWQEGLASTVLKVPHHGSDLGRWQQSFFDRVHPEVAVISVGRLHGLPTASVLGALQAEEARVLLTRDEGAVTIRTDGVRLIVRRWRSSRATGLGSREVEGRTL